MALAWLPVRPKEGSGPGSLLSGVWASRGDRQPVRLASKVREEGKAGQLWLRQESSEPEHHAPGLPWSWTPVEAPGLLAEVEPLILREEMCWWTCGANHHWV